MPNDPVNNPTHYNHGSIECIKGIESALTSEEYIGFLKGQVIKYVWRAAHKNLALQDLQKAHWYNERLITFIQVTPAGPPTENVFEETQKLKTELIYLKTDLDRIINLSSREESPDGKWTTIQLQTEYVQSLRKLL